MDGWSSTDGETCETVQSSPVLSSSLQSSPALYRTVIHFAGRAIKILSHAPRRKVYEVEGIPPLRPSVRPSVHRSVRLAAIWRIGSEEGPHLDGDTAPGAEQKQQQ